MLEKIENVLNKGRKKTKRKKKKIKKRVNITYP